MGFMENCLFCKMAAGLIPVNKLYEDDQVLAVFKPAGISCEADAKGGKTLPQLLKEQQNLPQEPLLCHRLDNPSFIRSTPVWCWASPNRRMRCWNIIW